MNNFPELFRCRCSTNEHMFLVEENAEDQEIYVSVYLRPVRFWHRIRTAALYLAGRRSKYGAFEEVILDQEQTRRLRDSLSRALENMETAYENQ